MKARNSLGVMCVEKKKLILKMYFFNALTKKLC